MFNSAKYPLTTFLLRQCQEISLLDIEVTFINDNDTHWTAKMIDLLEYREAQDEGERRG